MEGLLNQQGGSEEGLEEKRKKQKTREEVDLILATGIEITLENVQVIHAVDGWTLFETVDGEHHWASDGNLAYYRDPEGGE
jgi:hypothetical protein